MSFFGYMIVGSIIGLILHPHTHEYACLCDEPPIMTTLEASIIGTLFIIALSVGLYCLIRKLSYSKRETIILLIPLLLGNIYVCNFIRILLSTQVSG